MTSLLLRKNIFSRALLVAHLFAATAMDTFVVHSFGGTSACSSSTSMFWTCRVGDCIDKYSDTQAGLMVTSTDSHISYEYFQEPGCDGTVAKTEVFEVGACTLMEIDGNGPLSGSYEKRSLDSGESALLRIYSGEDCTGARPGPKRFGWPLLIKFS